MLNALTQRGFEEVGRYADGAFEISPEWRRKLVVYAWLTPEADDLRVVRVGIACAKAGMQTRYALYNKWLAGRFKPDDARETEVRRLMLQGLGSSAIVWAVEVDDRASGLALEDQLRSELANTLDLDLMVRTSWIKKQMQAWRVANPERSKTALRSIIRQKVQARPTPSRDRMDLSGKLDDVERWVKVAFEHLATEARMTGATASLESGPGARYGFGRGKLVGIFHPKISHLAVGLPERMRSNVAAKFTVRAQKGAVWFDVKEPSEVTVAAELVQTAARSPSAT